MAERRRLALVGAVLAVVALPLGLALTDVHLAGQPAALVVSTGAAALAVSALTVQPFLAGGGRIRWHRALGGTRSFSSCSTSARCSPTRSTALLGIGSAYVARSLRARREQRDELRQ